MRAFLRMPFGAGVLSTAFFALLGMALLAGFYCLRFYQKNDRSEYLFLRITLGGFLTASLFLIVLISTAVQADGMNWFYSQWLTGLLITLILGAIIVFLGNHLAKTKGDPMQHLDDLMN